MAPMGPLPTEIVALIIEQLTSEGDKSSTQAALSAVLVCRRWRLAGRKALWRDMVLKSIKTRPGMADLVIRPLPLQSLVDCSVDLCRREQSPFELFRSLTIVWPAIDHDFIPPAGEKDQWAWEARTRSPGQSENTGTRQDLLKSLPDVVRQMKQLTTFSFSMRDMESSFCGKNPWLSADDLVYTIAALPQSVQNLEIDIGIGYPKVPKLQRRPASYLCKAIAARLSQLKHARVRLPYFCPNVLAASTTLETLIFPLIDEHISMPTCGFCLQPQQSDSEDYERNGKAAREEFVAALKTYLPEWPNLKTLLVISRHRRPHLELSLATRDLLRDETTLNYCHQYFEDHSAYMDRKVLFMRYIDSDGMMRDLLCRLEESGELLEGPLWATTVNGSRFPKAYKMSEKGRTHIWRQHEGFARVEKSYRQALSAEWKQMYVDKIGETATKLWVDEAEAGRFLVKPQIVQGC